jgi:hypothetical protein
VRFGLVNVQQTIDELARELQRIAERRTPTR